MTEFENEKQEQIYPEFPMSEIRKMKDHPFKVKKNDDDMRELMESIREHGVMTPIIVRPIADPYAPVGQEAKKVYEIVSGHRRFTACRLLEMKMILFVKSVIFYEFLNYYETCITKKLF